MKSAHLAGDGSPSYDVAGVAIEKVALAHFLRIGKPGRVQDLLARPSVKELTRILRDSDESVGDSTGIGIATHQVAANRQAVHLYCR